jgi:hypothetical protein
MKSSNVLIIADLEDLIRLHGVPDYIDEDMPFNLRRKTVFSTDNDTLFYLNTLTYFNSMSYIEKNGRVRLTYLDFETNKEAVIYMPKLKLHRNLKLKEMTRAYNFSFEIEKQTLLIPYEMEGEQCFYQVAFSTGEHERVMIELYFDCKKRLRFISIGAYDF